MGVPQAIVPYGAAAQKGKSSFNGTTHKENPRKAVVVSGARCTTNGSSLVIEIDGGYGKRRFTGPLSWRGGNETLSLGREEKPDFFRLCCFSFLMAES